MNNKQLPPLPTLLHTRVVDGVSCISVSEHEYQMREYALQAIAHATQPAEVTDSMIREAFLTNGFTIKDGHSDLKPYVYAAARALLALQASSQVKDEPFGYIHHFVAHDESGALIDTTWEADGCADALPHPTFPDYWKWSHSTPFYTTPQAAQATQVEMTDAEIDALCLSLTGFMTRKERDRAVARAILALRPVQVPMTPTERERELDRSPVDASWEAGDAFMEGIYAAEAHHGITAAPTASDA